MLPLRLGAPEVLEFGEAPLDGGPEEVIGAPEADAERTGKIPLAHPRIGLEMAQGAEGEGVVQRALARLGGGAVRSVKADVGEPGSGTLPPCPVIAGNVDCDAASLEKRKQVGAGKRKRGQARAYGFGRHRLGGALSAGSG